MIIEFPTALYISELPDEPSDSQSVTFLISSEDPPRPTQALQQFPIAEQLKPLPDKIFTKAQNRSVVGELIFTVSQASRSDTGSSKKQFEVGQILDFETEEIPDLSNTEVPSVIELQQNTNILDLEDLGLTEEESNTLVAQSNTTMDELIGEINSIVEQINDNKIRITENQKSINEATKAINATTVILDTQTGGSDLPEVLQKLIDTRTDLETERDQLIADTNSLNEEVKTKYNELLSVRELVR